MPPLRISLALALLLVASLTVKGLASRQAEESAPRDTVQEASVFLAARGFAVTVADPNTAPIWITGSNGQCSVRIADIAPQGWARSIVAEIGAGQDVRFAFNGTFYTDQPVLWTNLAEYRQRLFRYFGLVAPPPVVRAILVSPACPSDTIKASDAALLS